MGQFLGGRFDNFLKDQNLKSEKRDNSLISDKQLSSTLQNQ